MRRAPLRTLFTACLVAAAGSWTVLPASGTAEAPVHGPMAPDPDAVLSGDALSADHASAPGAADLEGKEIILLNGLGTAPDKNPDPDRFDITVPVVSFATGKPAGTVRHEPRCASDAVPCLVLDDKDTYDLGDGKIVTRSRVSLAPDPDHPWLLLSSARPAEENIVEATGAYAGRTGKVRVSGIVDMKDYPAQITLDEVYVIVLDPR
jgi:hypothetical protein